MVSDVGLLTGYRCSPTSCGRKLSQIMQEPWLQHRQKEEDLRSPRSNSEILVYWAAPSGRWMREFS